MSLGFEEYSIKQNQMNGHAYKSLINVHTIFYIGGSYAFKLSSPFGNFNAYFERNSIKFYLLKTLAKSLIPLDAQYQYYF